MGNAVQILKSSRDTSIYDPITLATLRRLRDEAQPINNSDDIDPGRTRNVAEKAFAIQAGRSFTDLMNGSELRDSFRSFQRSLSDIQDIFRYSLLRDDQGVSLSRSKNGQKLIELNLEISAKQGFDPQIRMGENLRVRYDYTSQVPLLEYGFRF